MKTISISALLLATALSLAGCNRGAPPAANNTAATTPKPAETNTPAPAPAANEAADADEGGGAPTTTVGTARQNFSVVNATGHIVVTINVSPTTENEWGPDILGSQVMQPGQTAQVVFDRAETQCNYDLRVTYDDNDTSEMRNLNLCQVATVQLVDQ